MATTVVNCGINNYNGNFWDVALNKTANMKTAKTGLLVVDSALYDSGAAVVIKSFINFYKTKGVTYTLNVGLLTTSALKTKAASYDYIYIIGKTKSVERTADYVSAYFSASKGHELSKSIANNLGLSTYSFNIPALFGTSNVFKAFSNFFKSIAGKDVSQPFTKSDFASVATEQELRKLGTGKMVGVSTFINSSDLATALSKDMQLYGQLGTATKAFTGRPFNDNSWGVAKSETKDRFGVEVSDDEYLPLNFKGIIGFTGHGYSDASAPVTGYETQSGRVYPIQDTSCGLWYMDGGISVETKSDTSGRVYRLGCAKEFENTILISNACNIVELFPAIKGIAVFGNTRYGATFGGSYNGFATKEFYTKIKAGWSLGQAALSACCQSDSYWDYEMNLIGNPAFRIV